jgi:hypothetical protein
MPNPTYPALPSGMKPDSKQFQEERENPAMNTELEGGYVATRPKHTRAPRRDFRLVYVDLTDADKATLDNFWDTVKGSSVIFDWTHPKTGVVYSVRFKPGERLVWQYSGQGPRSRWDCSFILAQA